MEGAKCGVSGLHAEFTQVGGEPLHAVGLRTWRVIAHDCSSSWIRARFGEGRPDVKVRDAASDNCLSSSRRTRSFDAVMSARSAHFEASEPGSCSFRVRTECSNAAGLQRSSLAPLSGAAAENGQAPALPRGRIDHHAPRTPLERALALAHAHPAPPPVIELEAPGGPARRDTGRDATDSGYVPDGQDADDTREAIHSFWPISRTASMLGGMHIPPLATASGGM